MFSAVSARSGDVAIRLVRRGDIKTLERLLYQDRAWLARWEATLPGQPRSLDVRWMVRSLIDQAKHGQGLGFVIQYRGQIVGQLNVANIAHGALSSATIGYWIAKDFAGKGITPLAVALAIDHLFDEVGLHRVEIDIRPENAASLRVVEKLGLRLEGTKLRYIHIDGDWRDHLSFAITIEERPGSMTDRVLNTPKQ